MCIVHTPVEQFLVSSQNTREIRDIVKHSPPGFQQLRHGPQSFRGFLKVLYNSERNYHIESPVELRGNCEEIRAIDFPFDSFSLQNRASPSAARFRAIDPSHLEPIVLGKVRQINR